jgi:hypothetical protein
VFSTISVVSLVAFDTVLLVSVSFSSVTFVFVGNSTCAVIICTIVRYTKVSPTYRINAVTLNIFLIGSS